ncbi:MAG: fibronectin type III domain-containing protein [Bacteroidales bacterium]|nr:fibronectin type III domain-containing protein [Bacteroidales bacterium]
MPFSMPFGSATVAANSIISFHGDGGLFLGTQTTTYFGYLSTSELLVAPVAGIDGKVNSFYAKVDSSNLADLALVLEANFTNYENALNPDTANFNYQLVLHQSGVIEIIFGNCFTNMTDLRCLLRDGPVNESLFLSGTWDNPVVATDTATMSGVPSMGLKYTFTPPIVLCPAVVGLQVSSVDAGQAILSWNGSNDVSSWIVEYADSSIIPGSSPLMGIEEYATDTFHTLYNLQANTQYHAYVKGDCGSNGTSAYRHIAFRTSCGTVTTSSLPYSYGFEGNAYDACWTKGSGASSSSYPRLDAYASHSGSKSMEFYVGNATYNYIAAPLTENAPFDLQVSFWTRKYNYNSTGRFVVGIMSDPANISTFIGVDTVEPGAEWAYHTTVFNQDALSEILAAHIAFVLMEPGDLYLDDIIIEIPPMCTGVNNVIAQSVSASSALITWDIAQGQAPNSYEVVVTGADNSMSTEYVTEPSIALTGLTPGVSYKVVVTPDCGMGGTGGADSCVFSTLELECLLADTANAYSVAIGQGGTTTQKGTPFHPYYYHGYSQQLFTAAEMQHASTISYISLNHMGTLYEKNNVTIYMDTTTVSSFDTTTKAYVRPDAGLKRVYHGRLDLQNGWNEITLDNPYQYQGGNLLVVFVDSSNAYSNVSSFYCDTIPNMALCDYSDYNHYSATAPSNVASTAQYRAQMRFLHYPCQNVSSCSNPLVQVENVTSNTIDLSWLPGYQETSWDVDYRLRGDSVWTHYLSGATGSNTTIAGLQSNGEYEVRVVALCGAESKETIVLVTMQCGPANLPVVDSFNTYVNGSFSTSGYFARHCWVAGPNQVYVENVNNRSGMLRLYNSYLVLPEITEDINNLQVSFDLMCELGDSIIMGLCSGGNVDSVLWLGKYSRTASDELVNITVRMNECPVNRGQIFFRAQGTNGRCYIDNLNVDVLATCPRPEDITVGNVTATGAVVAWTNVENAAGYKVEYGVIGFVQGTGSVVYTTMPTCVLSNLIDGTRYDVYVSSICGAGDTSVASNRIRFATQCVALTTLPYTMNFDLPGLPTTVNETGDVPSCWTTYQLVTNPYFAYGPNIINNHYTAHSGNYQFIIDGIDMAVLPEMGMPIDTLALTFFVRGHQSNIIVGVVDGNNGNSSQNAFDTIAIVPVRGAFDWDSVTVFFNGYTGNGKHIAIKGSEDVSYNELYLDDVTIDYLPNCVPLSNITAVATGTTLTLDWNSITPNVSYVIEYGIAGFEQGTGTVVTATTTPVMVEDLVENTVYEFYVKNICNGGDTVLNPVFTAVTNLCDGISEATTATGNFEDMANQWLASNYKFSASQTMIKASEMAASGIEAGMALGFLSFEVAELGSNASYYDSTSIYIANTARNGFANGLDWDTVDARYTMVFSGQLPVSREGRIYVQFDSAFVWDGTSNVIIAINRLDGDWNSSTKYKVSESGDSNKMTVFYYDDEAPLDLSAPAGILYGRAGTWRANLTLATCGSPCSAPNVTVGDVDHEHVALSIMGSGERYEVAVKVADEAVWPAATVVQGNEYTQQGLLPATAYDYRVRQVCEEGRISRWTTGSFVTDSMPCGTPYNIIATPSFSSAQIEWESQGETRWSVHVWNSTYETFYDNVAALPFTVGDLMSGLAYNVAVKAVCGNDGLLESPYSDTINFTTKLCDVVDNVRATVQGSSVTVVWNAGENNTGSFEVRYGPEGFSANEGITVAATSTSVTLTNLQPGNYEVVARAICEANAPSAWTERVPFAVTVGMDDVENTAVSIFPNPAANAATISVSGVESLVLITMVDMNGRIVRSETVECAADCVKRINVNGLASGTYFVRVQGDGMNVVKKLVVK